MSYQQGEFVTVDHEGILFKAYMTIIINSLNISIPFVMKAVPEVWLSQEIYYFIYS